MRQGARIHSTAAEGAPKEPEVARPSHEKNRPAAEPEAIDESQALAYQRAVSTPSERRPYMNDYFCSAEFRGVVPAGMPGA
jgi:hypothetical protein